MQSNSEPKTIIITGSNRGLGLAILKLLAQKGSDKNKFIMAVRKPEEGEKVVKDLAKEIPDVEKRIDVTALDVADPSSIDKFVKWVQENYGSVDCLLNNSGVAVGGDEMSSEVVEKTFIVNVDGTLNLTEKLLPLIKKNGKVVFIGSQAGLVKNLKSEELKKEFLAEDISKERFTELLNSFRKSVEDGTRKEKGWPDSTYGASKLFIDVYPKVMKNNDRVKGNNIQVYVCCPGLVETDMTMNTDKVRKITREKKTPEHGAQTPAMLVELPWEVNNEYQAKFFVNDKVKPLDAEKEELL